MVYDQKRFDSFNIVFYPVRGFPKLGDVHKASLDPSVCDWKLPSSEEDANVRSLRRLRMRPTD